MISEGAGTATASDGVRGKRIAEAMEAAYLAAMAGGVNDPDALRDRKLAARTAAKAEIASEEAEARKKRRIKLLLEQRAEIDRQLAAWGVNPDEC